jgi:hypothetical protein
MKEFRIVRLMKTDRCDFLATVFGEQVGTSITRKSRTHLFEAGFSDMFLSENDFPDEPVRHCSDFSSSSRPGRTPLSMSRSIP